MLESTAVLTMPDLTQQAGWLPLVFALVMALAMLAYVILDGYDLGVGVLLRRADDEAQKDTMIASIGPFWDANETWLVQGVLTAAQAASKVPASNIAFTLAMYLSTYAMLLSAYVSVVFHLARKAAKNETSPGTDAKPGAKPDAMTNLGVAHA